MSCENSALVQQGSINHCVGKFPLWLAPDQVRIITLNDDEPLLNYAKQIVTELRAHEVRVTGDFSSDPMKAKIAEAEKARVHTAVRDRQRFSPRAWQRQHPREI